MPEATRHVTLPAFLDRLPAVPRAFAQLLYDTAHAGSAHQLSLYAPAIAYSLVISLAPILVGLEMFGGGRLASVVLPASPLAAGDVSATDLWGGLLQWAGPYATIVAVVLVLFGASSLFNQIVGAVGRIWEQPGGTAGMRRVLRQRALAVLLVIVALLALLASALGGVVVALLVLSLENAAAGAGVEIGWIESLIDLRFWFDIVFAWILFLAAFTAIPRKKPMVRDVAFGALLTALAYAAGQKGLSIYLGSSSRFTSLGNFGGFLALLVWAYYTGAIVLWGAELTHQLVLRKAERRAAAAVT